MQILKHYDSTR